MARVRYQPDYAGTGELMNAPAMLKVLTAAAEKGQEFAAALADVIAYDTGHYARSFEVRPAEPHQGPKRDRGEARLVNTATYAADVEWHDGKHILGRTVDAIEAGHL